MGRRSRVRRYVFGLLAVVAIGTPSCALVLGVQDDPTDAIAALCACDEVMKLAGTDCLSTLGARFSGSLPSVRTTWLQEYSARECRLGMGRVRFRKK